MRVLYKCAEDDTLMLSEITDICFCPDDDDVCVNSNTEGEMLLCFSDESERYRHMKYEEYIDILKNLSDDRTIDLQNYGVFIYRDEDGNELESIKENFNELVEDIDTAVKNANQYNPVPNDWFHDEMASSDHDSSYDNTSVDEIKEQTGSLLQRILNRKGNK